MQLRRIRDLREDQDLKQREVAAYLHVSQRTYSDYELGNLNLPVSVLDKLADFYHTSTDYLLERTDEKTPYPKPGKHKNAASK